MPDLVFTEDGDIDIAHDVIAGRYALSVLKLIKTNLALDRQTALADVLLASATYTGYADGVLTWLATSRGDNGAIEVVATIPEFRPADAVAPQDIYGAALINAAGTKLQAVASFGDPPLPMRSALNAILATLRYRPEGGSLVVLVS